jgi:hypothetical protein
VLSLPPSVRLFVATQPVDGRKGADSLMVLVRDELAHDPLSGHLFIFFSRRCERVGFGGSARSRSADPGDRDAPIFAITSGRRAHLHATVRPRRGVARLRRPAISIVALGFTATVVLCCSSDAKSPAGSVPPATASEVVTPVAPTVARKREAKSGGWASQAMRRAHCVDRGRHGEVIVVGRAADA